MPFIRSLPEHRRQRLISFADASHLDDFILKCHLALWVHGHIHYSHDYCIGSTRIFANPQAYPQEPNVQFDCRLVIELAEVGDNRCFSLPL